MAIGENFQSGSGDESATNNRSSAVNNRSYYSNIRINIPDKNTSFSFEFKSGLLQFKITSKDSNGYWKRDPDGVIYLSPTKAALLADQIQAMRAYMDKGDIDGKKAFGVSGGMNEKISFIAFQPTVEKRVNIVIGKFDTNGQIVERHECELTHDYNYSLTWEDLDAMKTEKTYNNDIELAQIYQLLVDFGRYMNGSAAYAQAYTTRFDLQRVLNKMDPIYDKLGIERLGNNGYSNNRNNDFINNMSGSSRSGDFDSLFSD